MNDGILIALLALVGSVLGGFASPVLLKVLDRRYARQDRVLDAEAQRQLQVRDALQEFSDQLITFALAWQNNADTDDYWLRLVGTHQRVQLLIEKKDAVVARELSARVAEAVSVDLKPQERAAAIGEINSALVVWYRGGDPEDVKSLLRPNNTPKE